MNFFPNFQLKTTMPQCHDHKEYTYQVSLSYAHGNIGNIRREYVESARVTLKIEFLGSRVNFISNFNIKTIVPQCHNHKEYTCQVSLSYDHENLRKNHGNVSRGLE